MRWIGVEKHFSLCRSKDGGKGVGRVLTRLPEFREYPERRVKTRPT